MRMPAPGRHISQAGGRVWGVTHAPLRPKPLTLAGSGQANSKLAPAVASVTIDLGNTGLIFSLNPNRFHIGESNGITRGDIVQSVSGDQKVMTLAFAAGKFRGGQSFRFGMSAFSAISGSTQMDPDRLRGAKVVLEATCVGCKVCTIACPFGTVNYVATTGKVQKCDLCGGNPACAAACPTGAITYVDANWTGLERMKQWASKTGEQPRA